MDELQRALKIAFASEFAFYLKAQYFHWNVEGPNFPQLHDLFGKIYEEVYGSIDTFAEEIRATGTYTPGSFTRFSILSLVDDEVEVLPAEMFRIVFNASEELGLHGLSDFLAGRQDAHKKHSWMLRSTLK
jgi:starvation-inducible DNA-binding protein